MSRTEARSREREAPTDRTRRPVEEPYRAPSVHIFNTEDKQDKKNRVPDRESG